MENQKKWLLRSIAILAIIAVAVMGWQRYGLHKKDSGIVSGNGRIEAVEIDVAAKTPGRVKEILVNEGDFVKSGQVVAVMDTETLKAQLHQAEAQLQQAQSAIATAQSQLAQRKSDKATALAVVAQRVSDLSATKTNLTRTMALAEKGFVSQQAVDNAKTQVQSAEATVNAARAQVSAADAAIASAHSVVNGSQSSAEAAQANLDRIQADIDDATLKAPRDGRVQYRVVQTGEVVAAGGRILSLLDLGDIYMTFFLPTADAGKLALGEEVHLVLDAVPQYVFPARISFVASEAQFTPKTVETASEREKLMFRVRAQISPDLVKKYITRVKTGLPGVAYVRLDPSVAWPDHLQVKMPE